MRVFVICASSFDEPGVMKADCCGLASTLMKAACQAAVLELNDARLLNVGLVMDGKFILFGLHPS